MPLKVDTEGGEWAAWSSKYRHEGRGIPILYVVRANGEVAYAKSGAKQGDELPLFLAEHLTTAGAIFSEAQLMQIKTAVDDSSKALTAGDSWTAVKRMESLKKIGQLGKFGSFASVALEADSLYTKLVEEGTAALKTAREQLAGEDKFAGVLGIVSANRIYGKLPELRKDMVSAERDLAKNADLKEELKQAEALDRANALLSQNSTKKQAKPALELIVTRFPNTPAAERAQAKLTELFGAAPTTPAKGAPAASGLRTWSDTTGKFRIEAELVNLEDGSVNLKKKSGEVVSVPLAKLSKADQEFVAKAESPPSDK
ncbi:MAG: SHD1 domain-containing protein [Pirellulaceae bacterium]